MSINLRGFKGWSVEYEDGSIIYEGQKEWKDIPKVGIVTLTLHYMGREWRIQNKEAYIQKKRASMVPGVQESFAVESRSIGYYENDCKVWYTVNENTGMMRMEIE